MGDIVSGLIRLNLYFKTFEILCIFYMTRYFLRKHCLYDVNVLEWKDSSENRSIFIGCVDLKDGSM